MPEPVPVLASTRAKTSTAADPDPDADAAADRGFHSQVNSWLLSPSPWISPSAKVDCCVSENKLPHVVGAS